SGCTCACEFVRDWARRRPQPDCAELRAVPRELDAEGRAVTRCGFGTDAAAVRFDDRTRDCETEAAATAVARAIPVEAVKALEHMLELVRRYPRPAIADFDLELTVAGACGHPDAIARVGVGDRVPHEIAQHLGQPVGIAFQRSPRALELEIAVTEERQISAQVLKELAQVDRAWLDQLARFGTRQREHVAHQAVELVQSA